MRVGGSGASRTCARAAAAMAFAALIAGCTMPSAVGSLSDMQTSARQGQVVLAPLTAQTLPPPPATAATFPAEFIEAGDFAYDRLGPGDRLAVRIWESGTPSVFGATGGLADVGEVVVDEAGRLYVPYAGSIRVAGLTIAQARSEVLKRLRTVVANPQVDIRSVETRSRLVSVQGAASKTGSYAIDRGRSQLGQLLAEVAPDQKNPEMLAVTVRRDGQTATVRLSDVYDNPKLDIPLRPGDSVILSEVVENVTVLGATGEQGTVQIPKRDFTLVEALGAAKGLSADTADPRAVFVVRLQADPAAPPLVYQVDMRRPETVALANRFIMRPGDSVLVSNASFAQTRQLLLSIAQAMTIGRNAALVVP